MSIFSVIKGRKPKIIKPPINKSDLYNKAFTKALKEGIQDIDSDNMKKIIFYGVRHVNSMKYPGEYLDKELVESKLSIIFQIKNIMSLLTPAQLLNIYPVTKTYDGDKYQWKDYFYTMKKLKEYDMDAPIGDKLDDLLWDYQNNELSRFQVTLFSTGSNLRRLQGEPTIMQEWCDKEGIESFTTNVSADGKTKYMQSSTTGKTFPMKPAIKKPRYLKVVG